MKFYVVLGVALAAFAVVDAQDTPKPTVKHIDYSALLNKTSSGSSEEQQQQQQQQQQQTIPKITGTVRPNTRATEAPTPGPTTAPTPAPTPDLGPWTTISIDHDQAKPFAQPQPVTVSEKAAVKYKPQLHITNGCHAYPAVDQAGQTSGGLKTKGAPSAGCKGSGWGSQVYGRSGWYQDVWAIMYSWYFPKDSPSTGLGHRHDWEHVIVWIDNPSLKPPKILAITPSAHSGYSKQVPPATDCVDGTSVKVAYLSKWPINHALESTFEGGETQDLIMWDQLSEDARRAMNGIGWGKANTPFNDGNFLPKLEKAWPF